MYTAHVSLQLDLAACARTSWNSRGWGVGSCYAPIHVMWSDSRPRWFVGNQDKKKPMILCARSTSRSREQSTKRRSRSENMWKVCLFYNQYNKISWLSNMADTFFEKFTKRAKVCGLFFLTVLFGRWLAEQAICDHVVLLSDVSSVKTKWKSMKLQITLTVIYQIQKRCWHIHCFLCSVCSELFLCFWFLCSSSDDVINS